MFNYVLHVFFVHKLIQPTARILNGTFHENISKQKRNSCCKDLVFEFGLDNKKQFGEFGYYHLLTSVETVLFQLSF